MAAALAGPVPAVSAAAVPRGPDAAAYRLDLTWTPSSGVLSGSERIGFRNPGPSPMPAVWIRAWPNAWQPVGTHGSPAGCGAPRVTVTMASGGTIGASAADCSAYRIDLASPVAAGARATVMLDFAVTVPAANDRFGTSHGITNIGNAVPVLAVDDARGWHLEPYTSTGESFYSLSSSWDATITAPAGVAVASTGAVVSTATGAGGVTTTVRSAHARDFALSVGAMNVGTMTVGPTLVRLFTATSVSATRRARLGRWARLAMSRYPRWFGAYGSPELDVVAGSFTEFGGMEYPEMIMTDIDKNSVVHEIAHQWFYGIVGDDQWREPWLDESFASYAESLVAPGYGCDAAHPVPRRAGVGLNSSMAKFDARELVYYTVVYVGGQCALRDLDRQYGHRAFLRLLRRYVRNHRFGVATTAGFVAAVAAHHPRGFSLRRWERRARIHIG